jgi:hypothetical protein
MEANDIFLKAETNEITKKNFNISKRIIKTRIERFEMLNGKGNYVVTYYMEGERAIDMDCYEETKDGTFLGYKSGLGKSNFAESIINIGRSNY